MSYILLKWLFIGTLCICSICSDAEQSLSSDAKQCVSGSIDGD